MLICLGGTSGIFGEEKIGAFAKENFILSVFTVWEK